jgi:hypothetical protein
MSTPCSKIYDYCSCSNADARLKLSAQSARRHASVPLSELSDLQLVLAEGKQVAAGQAVRTGTRPYNWRRQKLTRTA